MKHVEVSVGEDKVHGTMARIAITPSTDASAAELEEKIKMALSRYTIRYELTIG